MLKNHGATVFGRQDEKLLKHQERIFKELSLDQLLLYSIPSVHENLTKEDREDLEY